MIQPADQTQTVAVMTACVAGTAQSGHNAFTVVQVGVIVDNVREKPRIYEPITDGLKG